MTHLVALHGVRGSGKSYVASKLVADSGFSRLAFADALYQEVSSAFGVDEQELRLREWKEIPQNLLSIHCCNSREYRELMASRGESLVIPRTSRFHLRHWGTEYRRDVYSPIYWVNEFDETVRHLRGNLVVDDLRFYDTEYPYLRLLSQQRRSRLTVIEIIRNVIDAPAGHISDTRLPFHAIDHIVVNEENGQDAAVAAVLELIRERKAA